MFFRSGWYARTATAGRFTPSGRTSEHASAVMRSGRSTEWGWGRFPAWRAIPFHRRRRRSSSRTARAVCHAIKNHRKRGFRKKRPWRGSTATSATSPIPASSLLMMIASGVIHARSSSADPFIRRASTARDATFLTAGRPGDDCSVFFRIQFGCRPGCYWEDFERRGVFSGKRSLGLIL